MKRRLNAALAAGAWLACAPALASCQTFLAVQPAATAQVRATQSLYVAEAAFRGASAALEQASDQGLLKGPDAAKAREFYAAAHKALLAARLAKANGDFALELSGASDAITAAGRIQAIAGIATPISEP